MISLVVFYVFLFLYSSITSMSFLSSYFLVYHFLCCNFYYIFSSYFLSVSLEDYNISIYNNLVWNNANFNSVEKFSSSVTLFPPPSFVMLSCKLFFHFVPRFLIIVLCHCLKSDRRKISYQKCIRTAFCIYQYSYLYQCYFFMCI